MIITYPTSIFAFSLRVLLGSVATSKIEVTTEGKIEVAPNEKSKLATMAETSSWSSPDGPEMASNDKEQDRDVLLSEEESEDEEEESLSKRKYQMLGCSKIILVTLSIGLKGSDNHPFIDLETSPWSTGN